DGEHALARLSAAISADVFAPARPVSGVSGGPRSPMRSVIDSYDRGVAAIKAARWDAAIADLSEALKGDPLPRTYREGVLLGEYFPQYYLFVAYLKTGDLVKARQFYEARGSLPSKMAIYTREYLAELTAAEQKPR